MKRFLSLLLAIITLMCFAGCQNASEAESSTPTPTAAPTVTPTPHVHTFSSATCSAPETCSECGETQGEPIAHNYVAGECTLCADYNSSYCPKLYFTGDMKNMTGKKDVRNITFEYKSKEQVHTGSAEIKLQGNSSLQYEKKNYTISFFKDSECSEKLKIDVGWGKQSKYCLKANWIDKTHSRNVVTAKLAGEMQKKYGLLETAPNNGAVDGFPIEIYINNEFHGLYTMNIPKDEWMFNMDKDNPNHIVLCGEDWSAPVLFREKPTNLSSWTVEVGPENNETLRKIQRIVSFVRDSSDEDFKANFSQYFNLDSTLNYYIMMNYCWLIDNTGKNMLLVTYDGNVWYPSLYDLDTSWGANYKGTGLYNYKNQLLSNNGSLLWERLEKLFKKELADRYMELRKSVLDPNHVMAEFEKFESLIPDEVLARETAKWNTDKTTIPGYPISQIKSYLDTVLPRLDNKFKA
ncbi:MAG: CotH kinase family protein [Clostridia bacterium]|nr:CotH kinase family protein [Clostridia bacterium]